MWIRSAHQTKLAWARTANPATNVSGPAKRACLDGQSLRLVLYRGLFYRHVVKFVGVEYFAALKALDEFNVLFARHYAHSGVFALGVHVG